MAEYDLNPLFEEYPSLIEQMPDTFTSHAFILNLAQQNQPLYIDAVNAYRDSTHEGTPAPFKAVHGRLSKQLHNYPNRIKYVEHVQSKDIFNQSSECASWIKINQ